MFGFLLLMTQILNIVDILNGKHVTTIYHRICPPQNALLLPLFQIVKCYRMNTN